MAVFNPSLTHDEWADLLLGESLLFGLLGKLLYTNPEAVWLEALAGEDLFDEVPFAGEQDATVRGAVLLTRWFAAVRDGLSPETLSDVRVDYARLFVSERRMQVPAWESVYFSQERLTFQAETLDVRNWYRRFEVEPGTAGREPDDHIAFELSFVAHCAELAVQAFRDEDAAAFADLLAAQREFLAQHLLRWGWKWAELAEQHAATDFYRGLALLVQGGLQTASKIFDIPILTQARFVGLLV